MDDIRILVHAHVVEIVADDDASREELRGAWKEATGHGKAVIQVRDRSAVEALASMICEAGELTAPIPEGWFDVALACGQLLDARVIGAEDLRTLFAEEFRTGVDPLRALDLVPPVLRVAGMRRACRRAGIVRIPLRWRRDFRGGSGLAESAVHLSVDDPVATVSLARPHALNALDPGLLTELEDVLEEVHSRRDLQTLILRSQGDAFMAGIDAVWVHQRMADDDLDAIVAFVRRAHAVLHRLDTTPLTTIARVHGLASGAGTEFAIACDHVVCAERGRLVLPETGLGIHPAMGGTQRLPRRIGRPAARWMILTGRSPRATQALQLGLVDEVVPANTLDDTILRRATEPGRRPARVERAPASSPPVTGLEDALAVFGAEPVIETQQDALSQRLRGRAPIALRVADGLIEMSTRVALDAGLEQEIADLATVFATQDAMKGIAAAARGRRGRRFDRA